LSAWGRCAIQLWRESDLHMELHDHFELLKETDPQLAGELSSFTTLEHVLNWMKGRRLDLASLDMVTQDEYCHDPLVPLPVEKEWLVFAMT